MKDFIKQKFYGRLLSFLKFKRHKKIRTLISSSKKRMCCYRDAIAPQKRQTQPSYFLKRLDSYVASKFVTKPVPHSSNPASCHVNKAGVTTKHPETAGAGYASARPPQVFQRTANVSFLIPGPAYVGNRPEDTNEFLLTKKKYKLYSVLFNIICKWPGRRPGSYIKSIQGQKGARWPQEGASARKYYTIPYRLSLSRFIGNKILHKCGLCPRSKVLLKLRKKLLIRAKRCGKSLSSFSLKPAIETNWGSVTTYRQKKELARDFILALESRLDNSLLRLLQFKALYTLKQIRAQKQKSLSARSADSRVQISPQWTKVKSPWKNYSAGQVKQKINHGHIYLNGKKVKSGNIRLGVGNQIAVSGFVPSSTWAEAAGGVSSNSTSSNKPFDSICNNDAQLTLYSRLTAWLRLQKTDPNSNNINFICDYIKNLKIKRFTEIFYITYKNLHLFTRDKSCAGDSMESRIKPFFQTVGYNQSIYLLWPVLCLLALRAWGPEIKRNIVRSSGSESLGGFKKRKVNEIDGQTLWQKNLRSLLTQKKLQNQALLSPNRAQQVPSKLSSAFDGSVAADLTKSTPKGKMHMLDQVNRIYNINPSWIYAKSLGCYAAVVYGTRKCKWVQLQQRKQGDFYNRVCNKLNFFELELDFFQLAYRHYKGH